MPFLEKIRIMISLFFTVNEYLKQMNNKNLGIPKN